MYKTIREQIWLVRKVYPGLEVIPSVRLAEGILYWKHNLQATSSSAHFGLMRGSLCRSSYSCVAWFCYFSWMCVALESNRSLTTHGIRISTAKRTVCLACAEHKIQNTSVVLKTTPREKHLINSHFIDQNNEPQKNYKAPVATQPAAVIVGAT